jgi:uncharacterized protein (TIGR02271 family)
MERRVERVVIPVAREEVAVGKRSRPSERVRVHKRVIDAEVPVELVSAREEIDIERVPIDRIVTSMPEPRVEGDTTIVPVVEEMVVIEKRLVLKEEIRITKRRTEQKRVVNVPVKREQVNIERELADGEPRRRAP